MRLAVQSTVAVIGTFFVVGLLIGPGTYHCCPGESKAHIASAMVKKYAYEAFPSWVAAHPDVPCHRISPR